MAPVSSATHGCGICQPTAGWSAGGEETLVVSGVGNPSHFQETGVHTRHPRQPTEHVISDGGDEAVALGDDPADETCAAGDLGDVRFTFGLVGVEQRVRCLSPEHRGEFPAQVGHVADPGGHALADPRWHGVRGVPGQEDASHPPPVGDTDVVAVDHGPQDLDVFGCDALVAEHLPDLLFAQQCLLVLIRARGVLPSVVTEWGRAVDRGTGWVAVEPEPVVGVPLLQHLGVDDDPSLGVGAARIADAQLTAGRRRAAVGGDHIGRAEPLEGVGAQVGQHEFDLVALRHARAGIRVRASTSTFGKRATPSRRTWSTAGW